MVDSFALLFKEVFVNGFTINEFDEFNLDRAQVEVGSFPPVASNIPIVSSFRKIHVPNFKRSETERLFVIPYSFINILNYDSYLTKFGWLDDLVFFLRFLIAHNLHPCGSWVRSG